MAAAPEVVSAVVEPRTVFPAAEPKAFFSVSELQVFFVAVELEAVSEVALPQAFSVAAGPEVVFAVAELQVVSVVAHSEVFAAVAPEAVFAVAEPQVVFVVAQSEVFAAAAPEAVFAVAQLQVASVVVAPEAVSVDIAVAFVVLVLASVVVVEADSSGRPRFLAFPNADHFASFSSSVEVVGEESVHSPIGAHTNYGLCSILSSLDLHHNRNLGHCYNNSNPGYNTVIDTNGLPMGATTNHPRKTSLYLYQEQRKHHLCRASRPHPEVPQIRSMVVRSSFHLHFGLHNLVRQGCSSPAENRNSRIAIIFISRIFFMVSSLFYPGVFKLTPLWNNFLLQHMVYKGHKKLVWLPHPPAFYKDYDCKFTLSEGLCQMRTIACYIVVQNCALPLQISCYNKR